MQTKKLGVVDIDVKAIDSDDEAGAFEAVLSAPTLDRDGEIIDAKAFEPLPDHITIDVDHGMTVSTTVGSGVPFYDGDVLKVRGSFSTIPRAQEVRTLVAEGHIRKMSVAFMDATRSESADGVHITSAELLNAAIVPIPSNRDADILVAKALAARATEPATRGRKALDGSYEQRSDQLREALRAAYPAARWLWIRATFDDSVIFELENEDGTTHTFQAGYTRSGSEFTFGDPVEVDIAEVVVAPATATTSSPATDPEVAAAPAAAPPAKVPGAQALAALAEAEALLA